MNADSDAYMCVIPLLCYVSLTASFVISDIAVAIQLS